MIVLLFGPLRQCVGRASVEVPEGLSSVRALEDHLVAAHPTLAPHRASWRVALNQEYASGEAPLTGVREAALIPPVSGG